MVYWGGWRVVLIGEKSMEVIWGSSWASQVAQWQRIYLPMEETQETWVQSLGREDPLEEGMITHTYTFAWKVPWTEKPDEIHTVQGITKN